MREGQEVTFQRRQTRIGRYNEHEGPKHLKRDKGGENGRRGRGGQRQEQTDGQTDRQTDNEKAMRKL